MMLTPCHATRRQELRQLLLRRWLLRLPIIEFIETLIAIIYTYFHYSGTF